MYCKPLLQCNTHVLYSIAMCILQFIRAIANKEKIKVKKVIDKYKEERTK